MITKSSLTFAQVSQEWIFRYSGQGNSNDEGGTSVLVDNFGDILVGGSIYNSENNSDFCVIKYNPDGIQKWIAIYNSPYNKHDFLNAMVIDKFGNVYVTGQSVGDEIWEDYTTIKYDPAGIVVWTSTFNGTDNRRDEAFSIALDSIGNTYVTGFSYGFTSGEDFATIKYNNSGQIIWVKTYNNPTHNDQARKVAVTKSGLIYVAGWSVGSSTGEDYAVVKYDSSGNQIWVQRYDGPSHTGDYCQNMTVDDLENVYLTGYTRSSSADYTTVKYDSSGNIQWVRFYDAAGSSDVARDIVLDKNNNVYVTGSSIGQGTGYDYVTIKYDTDGNQKWISKYTPGNGLAFSIKLDETGNIYVTGRSNENATGNDYVTVKYDSLLGAQQWSKKYDFSGIYGDYGRDLAIDNYGNVYVTGQSDRDILTIKYSQLTGVNPISFGTPSEYKLEQNYPNPFNPATVISYELKVTERAELIVYDILGNEIATLVDESKPAGSYEIVFDGSDFPSGIYFYSLRVDGNLIDTKRMVLLK